MTFFSYPSLVYRYIFCKYGAWVQGLTLHLWINHFSLDLRDEMVREYKLEFQRIQRKGQKLKHKMQLQRIKRCSRSWRRWQSLPHSQALTTFLKSHFVMQKSECWRTWSHTYCRAHRGMSLPCRLLAQDPSVQKHQAVPERLLMP